MAGNPKKEKAITKKEKGLAEWEASEDEAVAEEEVAAEDEAAAEDLAVAEEAEAIYRQIKLFETCITLAAFIQVFLLLLVFGNAYFSKC
jgi:hypothetical protein